MKYEKMLVVHVLSSDTLIGLLTERPGMHFFLLNQKRLVNHSGSRYSRAGSHLRSIV